MRRPDRLAAPEKSPPSARTRRVLVVLMLACAAVLAVLLPLAAGRGHGGADPLGPGPSPGSGADLLAALALVALLAHLGGLLARRCRQPPVVGQLAAGVLLGPSVLGAVLPAVSAALFGPSVLPHLRSIGELGLTFFVFQVGHELTRRSGGSASRPLFLAGVGVLVPFTLGAGLAVAAYGSMAPAGVGLLPFACFLGLALSATALPVLARVLADLGPRGGELAGLALPAAVYTDGLIWLGVAALSVACGGGHSGLLAPVAIAAGVVVVVPVRRLLAGRADAIARVAPSVILTVVVVVVLLVGAVSAATLGNPGLGAIACGLVLPAGVAPLETALRHLRAVTDALLLPVFFALAGLGVRLDTLGGGLPLLAAVLLAGVVGKFGGSALAARAQSWSWRTAVQFGVLMNCRGVTELVLISVGVSLGLVGDRLYTTLVLLALGSTALTGPLLGLVSRLPRAASQAVPS